MRPRTNSRKLQAKIDAVDAWSLDQMLDTAMDALRLPPVTPGGRTSPAAKRRVALAGCCSRKPDLLLLDEPTNHLDAESVAWLERHLEEYPGTVVAVTHDRYFLDNVAGWILELDRGRGIPFEAVLLAGAEAGPPRPGGKAGVGAGQDDRFQSSTGFAGSRRAGARVESRLARYEELLAEEKNVRLDQVQIHIPAGDRLGNVVIDAEHLNKAFGEALIDGIPLQAAPAIIVGIIGPNGAGKTTLSR